MIRRVLLVVFVLLLLVGAIAGIKALQIGRMIAAGKSFIPPPETVTTAVVRSDSWERQLAAVGSMAAVQGVTVSAEVAGRVTQIAFTAGSLVKAGELLVQQDTSVETAQLHVADSRLRLARITFERARQLLPSRGVSRSEYDAAEAQLRQNEAEVENIRALIARKSIRAPFTGRLGIRLVDLGSNLKEGEAIVSLQTMDPIHVNFSLPQQHLAHIATGLTVRVATDALPGHDFTGTLTVINPEVDAQTRNVRVQATLANNGEELRPGMYASVRVLLPKQEAVLAIPATAVLHAPYSDSVFVVEEQQGQQGRAVRQQFVRLGERRGDYVAVLSGLSGTENVVSSGVFKLRNGQAVVVDNTLAPQADYRPSVSDS